MSNAKQYPVLEKRLKVKVNPDKTKVGSPLWLKFLGFSLGVDQMEPTPVQQNNRNKE